MYMPMDEILTADALVQPSPEQLKHLTQLVTTPYKDDIYYHQDGANITVMRKRSDEILGLLIAQAYHNPLFEQIPDFIVPRNLYSWAEDKGVTALLLIKALVKTSPLPVVSDLEMTKHAKQFLEKQIVQNTLKARTLNLNTGEVTPYDLSIWNQDDDYRVLILDQPFGTPISGKVSLVQETTWNHAQLLRTLGRPGV
jgi:hypothetical protein